MEPFRFQLFSAAVLSAVGLLLPLAPAQTGPWTEGELIVRQDNALYRIAPESGNHATLITVQYWGGAGGDLAFDSFRGGVLANASLAPDGTFVYRLWLVLQDGTAAAMPGFTGSLRALASAGDGRIFFMRNFSQAQGPQTVEYYDANDVLQVLKAADGVTPFQIEVDHLIYDAPSNALIGSSQGWFSATHCMPGLGSLYRIPLSADGLRVDGLVTCTATPVNSDGVIGLDHLPDGKLLATQASTSFPPVNPMLAVDPITLASTNWAEPDQGNVVGGLWSDRIGTAIIHATISGFSSSELRTFGPGQIGFGGLLSTTLPVGSGHGLVDVDVLGPACEGFTLPYGTGLAGKAGQVPLLGVIGCPDIGQVFTISINSVVGSAGGMLFVGLSPASAPFKGGTFLVGGIAAQVALIVGGAPGVAGAGSLALPAVLPTPVLAGVNLYMQAGFADAAAVKGVSLTNGVQFQGD